MKTSLLASLPVIAVFLLPTPALAVFSVGQGGTGQTSFPVGACILGNGTNPLTSTYSPSFASINATSTTATSTFSGNANVLGSFSLGNLNASYGAVWNGSLLNVGKENRSLSVGFLEGENAAGISTENPPPDVNATSIRIFGGEATGNGSGASLLFSAGNSLDGVGSGGIVEIDSGGPDGDIILYSYRDTTLMLPDGKLRLNYGNQTQGQIVVNGQDTGGTFAFPNNSGTFGLLEADQTWSGVNVFSQGPTATTTFTIGQIGSTTSKACFNTKNTAGDDISFYFVGTSMVVESNVCQ